MADGWSEWAHPVSPFSMQCCDCGLVHELEFAVVEPNGDEPALNDGEGEDGVIIFRARRAGAQAYAQHLCGGAVCGDYTGQVELIPPPFLARDDGRGICVDVCLALEVSNLWKAGIKTTGCCCGHGTQLGYIGVTDEFIPAMKALGYAVRPNPCRPGAEDSFVPKTALAAGQDLDGPVGDGSTQKTVP